MLRLRSNRWGRVIGGAVACVCASGVIGLDIARAQATPLTAAQQNALVQAHNRWRAAVKVPPLVWSDALAQSAAQWAAQLARDGAGGQCHLGHSDTDVGENLYWLSPIRWNSGRTVVQDVSPAQVVDVWGQESAHYQYTSNTCQPGKTCGHYTQVVWKDTREVGCALRVCSAKDQVWVCQYRPAGNFIGEWPY